MCVNPNLNNEEFAETSLVTAETLMTKLNCLQHNSYGILRLWSFGMWHHVVFYITKISEKPAVD